MEMRFSEKETTEYTEHTENKFKYRPGKSLLNNDSFENTPIRRLVADNLDSPANCKHSNKPVFDSHQNKTA